MPGQLAANAVRNGRDELAAEAELAGQLLGELLRAVVRLGHVPLELVDERHVAHVYVELDGDALVRVRLDDVVRRVALELLANGGRDGRHERRRIQVKVVAQDLGEGLGRNERFF